MSLYKILFQTAAVFAITLGLISCGGTKTKTTNVTAVTGNQAISSPLTELTGIANSKFSDHYYGIGDGVSTREGMAASTAAARARENLALMIQAEIDAKLKDVGINPASGEASETTVRRLNQQAMATLTNVRQQEIRVLFNQGNNQYTVYALMTVPKNEALGAFKNSLANDKSISDAVYSKALMDLVDSMLDK